MDIEKTEKNLSLIKLMLYGDSPIFRHDSPIFRDNGTTVDIERTWAMNIFTIMKEMQKLADDTSQNRYVRTQAASIYRVARRYLPPIYNANFNEKVVSFDLYDDDAFLSMVNTLLHEYFSYKLRTEDNNPNVFSFISTNLFTEFIKPTYLVESLSVFDIVQNTYYHQLETLVDSFENEEVITVFFKTLNRLYQGDDNLPSLIPSLNIVSLLDSKFDDKFYEKEHFFSNKISFVRNLVQLIMKKCLSEITPMLITLRYQQSRIDTEVVLEEPEVVSDEEVSSDSRGIEHNILLRLFNQSDLDLVRNRLFSNMTVCTQEGDYRLDNKHTFLLTSNYELLEVRNNMSKVIGTEDNKLHIIEALIAFVKTEREEEYESDD